MNRPISAVIRTYNEAEYIGRLIQTLRAQTDYGKHLEIITVDSGSTDDTVDILKNNDIDVLTISRAEFNYSKALNLGIEHSKGYLIVILSAHAIPCEEKWLAGMAETFEDQTTAGAYCRQIPWPQADPIEVKRITKMFPEDSMTFSNNTPLGNMNFSNAASCIRRRIWEKHPFAILPAAEDREWSKWAVRNGYKIVYDSKLRAYHSHTEPSRKTAQRIIEIERSADVPKHPAKTSAMVTLKKSIGWFRRDMKTILCSNCSVPMTIKYSMQCLQRSFWYVVDFHRGKNAAK
ncbi:MAG TPA: glycosyltransferase [Sedimentisphaerales bacterium]|nr:glycosyltransferase [Sedimentisphaerales bacterium]